MALVPVVRRNRRRRVRPIPVVAEDASTAALIPAIVLRAIDVRPMMVSVPRRNSKGRPVREPISVTRAIASMASVATNSVAEPVWRVTEHRLEQRPVPVLRS